MEHYSIQIVILDSLAEMFVLLFIAVYQV